MSHFTRKAPRRVLAGALAMLFALFSLHTPARAEYWDDAGNRAVACRENKTSCLILQMTMMGGFDAIDTADNLSVRVMSAALSMLLAVTEADFAHFTEEFGAEIETVRGNYYIALGNCLLADIILSPAQDDAAAVQARQVLKLFLEHSGAPSKREQMAIIRSGMTDDLVATLATAAGVPADFVEYLVYSDDWRVFGGGAP